ncbi:DegT/DnrJ/EryC1/StrS family aminotransferase [Massilia sp. DWR3-1-1]|uniref:DegT/DnrJ/EryC1/StrS family aminotransferase n=1 Tax=Massilia sp. DWR3-1-1 TaxID=2804559 RepID=UPI003CED617A
MTHKEPVTPSSIPLHPDVPLAPVLSLDSFRQITQSPMPCVLDVPHVRLVTSGRIALGLALRELGVGEGDVVLLPAYHSLSMVPPVLWLKAEPRFYRVDAGANADMEDLTTQCDARVRVLVTTHYFGFPQNLTVLRAFCDQRGIALVEDCAHAFFGAYQGKPLGSYGDYAIASSMKFFPMYEGGVLISARRSLDAIVLVSGGKGFEAKVVLATLERSFSYGRLMGLKAPLVLPLRIKDWLWQRIKVGQATSAPLAPGSSDSDASFDTAWLDKSTSLFARFLLARLSKTRITGLRRRNYQCLQQTLRGLPGCRPLFATLPDSVCPWLFPLLVDDADAVFARVRAMGVPVVRFAETLWPAMDIERCVNSRHLSRHVLAFPCHQELNEQELNWMCAQLLKAIRP